MTQVWLCEFHTAHLVAMLLQWLGFGYTARQQLQNSDLLELLQFSEDQIDGLQINELDKAELKRWQKATAALAEVAESDRDQTLFCSVQYALYTHLSDRALEIAGSDIKPDDIQVVSVEPRRNAIQAKLSVKLKVSSALVGKLFAAVRNDASPRLNYIFAS